MRLRHFSLLVTKLFSSILFVSCCDAQIVVGISSQIEDVSDIAVSSDATWISTTSGAFKIVDGKVSRLTDSDLVVNKVAEVSGALWLATTIGAYRISGQTMERIPDRLLDVWTLQAIPNGNVVLGTAGSAYLWDGSEPKKFGPSDVVVTRIYYRAPYVWLATDKGAYRVSLDGHADRIPNVSVPIRDILFVKDTAWVSTAQGAYRIDPGKPPERLLPDQDVQRVRVADGNVWLAGQRGAYRLVDGQALRVPDIQMSVEEIVGIDGFVWIASHQGAYKIDAKGEAHLVGQPGMSLKTVRKLGNSIWLGGYHGAYVVKNDRVVRIPDVDLEVHTFQSTPDSLWIGTNLGAYRILDANVAIALRNESVWGTLASSLIRGPVLVGGNILVDASYKDSAQSPALVSASTNAEFRTLVSQRDKQPSDDQSYINYLPINRPAINLSVGVYSLHVAVRDKWGNVGTDDLKVTVLPGPLLAAGLLAGVALTFIVICIFLAPTMDFANDVLMNPWLRGIGSFGLVPLALSMIPAARRRLLQRYSRVIASTFDILSKNYELPHPDFSPPALLSRLSTGKGCLITGQSGIGKTSYLMFLAAAFALPTRLRLAAVAKSAPNSTRTPVGLVPVFVPLIRHRGKKVEDMIAAQLASYGSLRDRQLVDWYVAKGGFLFLIDGLNEVDAQMQSDVNSFLEGAKTRNYFCVTSQIPVPSLSWVPNYQLKLLSSDSIRRILQSRLPADRYRALTEQVPNNFYDLFGLPQDLEFLIRFLAEHPKEAAPKSKRELYLREFETVFDFWSRVGRADFRDVLIKRAFAMLQSKVPSINDESLSWSVDFGAPLLERKLAVQRDADYFFSHNLVRDYLASTWLEDKWRSVLSQDALDIDSNWSEVFKFILESFASSTEARELVFLLLPKSRRIAGEAFKWLETTREDLLGDWATSFKLEFAEMELKE